MSNARVKNLILLILALAVVFLLLAVVPGKLSARQAQQRISDRLSTLLSSYGVTLAPEALQTGDPLYAIELAEPDNAAAAEALLGSPAALDTASTRYESVYRAESGLAQFHRGGALSATLSSPIQGKTCEDDQQRRLRAMGYSVWQTQPGVRGADGSYTLTAEQALLNVPVFDAQLTFTYHGGALCTVDGVFFAGSAAVSRVSESSCISCADAITQILASRDATGWVGSQISAAQQGYLYTETATSALRFYPVWRIETDTAVFYVNGITREVRQAEA